MQSLSAVAEQVRQKVYTYIYRLTLDYHLTEDLTQETVLEMIKSLSQLEVPHVNGFWLKLRGFLLSFSATNPCEAKSRYLLLQSGLLTNGIKESQAYQVTVDSDKPGDHK